MDDRFFMFQALAAARRALEREEFPVGCVIAQGDEILAVGARQGSAGPHPSEIGHAEIVALEKLAAGGGTPNLKRATLYCTMEPCLMCFGAILLSGIGRLVYGFEDIMGGAVNCDRSQWSPLYRDNPIRIEPQLLRRECLALFQAFFKAPQNRYWQASLLARYTLAQGGQL